MRKAKFVVSSLKDDLENKIKTSVRQVYMVRIVYKGKLDTVIGHSVM